VVGGCEWFGVEDIKRVTRLEGCLGRSSARLLIEVGSLLDHQDSPSSPPALSASFMLPPISSCSCE
jgi:hypothetical protein